jgi:NTE family protein
MRNIRKIALSLALIALAQFSSFGDGLSFNRNFGTDPAKDSVAFAQIRQMMDNIREKRPTVALVLSGGGAKGAAHVGVIKYLQEIGIPVDIVLGTSMGGLVGGLFALGYTPEQMDTIMTKMDWQSAMNDKIPREYFSYSQIKYKEKYLLSIPFYYRKRDFIAQKADEVQYSSGDDKYDKLKLSADADASQMIKDNLLGSLPSGYIFGQNVSNIISALSVGYQDSMKFTDLPVPFVCVSTEMVTGKAKIWYDGKLPIALRSTMSIPGIFSPVKIAGMVLVDGGMRDNYPTDLAKQFGADIIIGVDLSSGYKTYGDINNLGDIISQGVDMLGRASYEQNVKIPDVTIVPEISEYNMLSFDPASIDTIMSRGYQAALKVSPQLLALKNRIGNDMQILVNSPAINVNEEPVTLANVDIVGIKDKEKEFVMKKIGLKAGDKVTKSTIDKAVGRVYGMGAFDFVTYELRGEEEPFNLVFSTKRGPVNQFGIGARFDTEEVVAVLINVGLNVHRLSGSAYDFEAKIGTNPYAQFHYSFDTPSIPTINGVSSVRWTDRNTFSIGQSNLKVSYWNIRNEIYFSNMRWSMFDIKVGIRNDYYTTKSVMADQVIGDYDLNNLKNDYTSLHFSGRADTFDDGYFPSKGYNVGGEYLWNFYGIPNEFKPFQTVKFDAKTVIPASRIFAVIPSLDFRFIFGNNAPLIYSNMIGGSMAGRYQDQQIPFIGINNAKAMRSNVVVGRVDLRFKVFKNNYLSTVFNAVDDFDSFKAVKLSSTIFGTGVEYAYDSIVGPIRLNLHWSSATHRLGAYFSLGFDF